MTVTYSLAVSEARLCGFTKLLFRWRGSIYKLIARECAIFAGIYYLLYVVRTFALTPDMREVFNNICLYFREHLDLIPITFVLGFYVSVVVTRWWDIYMNMPWVDRPCVVISAYVRGTDEKSRIMRRSMVRYLNIMAVLCLRCVSGAVKKRFPTFDHLVEAKIMTAEELKKLQSVNMNYGHYFQPAFWFGALAMEAKSEGRIQNDFHLKTIMDEMGDYRSCLGALMSYDWISVPLVYTQVVSIAIYTFFFGCLFGRQYIEERDGKYFMSQYFPLWTFIQFFFYVGWLKVAEVLINPLGEDDDDFEVNHIIDRNIAVGFMMVDDLYGTHPELVRDPHWDESEAVIPYTEAAASTCIEPFLGSANEVDVPQNVQEWAEPEDEAAAEQAEGDDNVPEMGSPVTGAIRKFTRTLSNMASAVPFSRQASHAGRRRSRTSSHASISPSHVSLTPSEKSDVDRRLV